MKLISRPSYLDFLVRHRNRPLVKVVSGVRRSGKSTLFALYRKWLEDEGVPDRNIIAVNFEDLAFENLCEYHALYRYVTDHMVPGEMNYIFLDEIQHVPYFEKVVDSLFIKENADVYITGSNSYFLSGELATLLSGRYVELDILPLSFREFCSGLPDRPMTLGEKYNLYLQNSGFPYALQILGQKRAREEYLTGLFNTILVKDVLGRLSVKDPLVFESVARYMAANVGSLISPNKIASSLTSQGRKTDNKTVERYLKGLMDSLFLYRADRYDVRGKGLLKINAKYYMVDPAFRQILMSHSAGDTGHVLENVVYLELVRRYGKGNVFVGQVPGGEIDFVCRTYDGCVYYQVSVSTLSSDVLERELKPLQQLNDQYPKFLLTLDDIDSTVNYGGIQKRNALEWMMEG